MDFIKLTEYLLRNIRDRRQQVSDKLTYGGCPNWETYQKLVGEVSGLTYTENEILDLLKKMEKLDDDD
jgi:hypothetical protein